MLNLTGNGKALHACVRTERLSLLYPIIHASERPAYEVRVDLNNISLPNQNASAVFNFLHPFTCRNDGECCIAARHETWRNFGFIPSLIPRAHQQSRHRKAFIGDKDTPGGKLWEYRLRAIVHSVLSRPNYKKKQIQNQEWNIVLSRSSEARADSIKYCCRSVC